MIVGQSPTKRNSSVMSEAIGVPDFLSLSLRVLSNLLLTSNLVSHSLGLNDSNIINDSLVEVEVSCEPNTWISG